jgi:hypothetical protein
VTTLDELMPMRRASITLLAVWLGLGTAGVPAAALGRHTPQHRYLDEQKNRTAIPAHYEPLTFAEFLALPAVPERYTAPDWEIVSAQTQRNVSLAGYIAEVIQAADGATYGRPPEQGDLHVRGHLGDDLLVPYASNAAPRLPGCPQVNPSSLRRRAGPTRRSSTSASVRRESASRGGSFTTTSTSGILAPGGQVRGRSTRSRTLRSGTPGVKRGKSSRHDDDRERVPVRPDRTVTSSHL